MTEEGLTVVAPDGRNAKVLREDENWVVYGWSADASTLYGVRQSDDSQHLVLVALNMASGRERGLNETPRQCRP